MFWIDIEDANGVKVGDGPMQCLAWEHTPRLSRAGSWKAEIPLGESKLQYATNKMRVRCWQATPFGVIDIGSGVIDSRLTKIATGGSTIEIGGSDLLIELAYRLVFEDLHEVTTYTPVCAALVGTVASWFAWDGDEESPELAVQDTDNYVWIGLPDTTFNRIDFVFSLPNTTVTSVNVGVSDERGGDLYREPDDVEDTTINAGAPLGQNGYIRFTRPASWFTREIGDTGIEVEAFWVRLDPEADLWNNEGLELGIQFDSISVKSFTPQLDDLLYLLETYAPDWSFSPDYFDRTEHGTLRTFDGDSLLNVFVNLSEERGEHFRLGNGREIEWLRQGFTDSGIIALQAVGEWGAGTEGNVFEYGEFEELLPTPPATPTGFMAQPTGTNNLHVGLSWDDMGADGYIVEYDDGGGWVEIADTASVSYTHTTPSIDETDHYYRVRAYNSNGESANATTHIDGLLLGAVEVMELDQASGNETGLIGGNVAVDNNTVGSAVGKVTASARDFVAANGEYLVIATPSSALNFSGDFTIGGWMYFTATSLAAGGHVIDRRNATNGWSISAWGAGRIAFALGGDDSTAGTFATDTWHQVLMEYDAGSSDKKGYVNNTLEITATRDASHENQISFGRHYSGVAQFTGRGNGFWFWARRLSAAQKARFYNSGAGISYPP